MAADLPAQLSALNFSQLRDRALEEGCTPEQVDDARTSDAPLVALKETILRTVRAQAAFSGLELEEEERGLTVVSYVYSNSNGLFIIFIYFEVSSILEIAFRKPLPGKFNTYEVFVAKSQEI